MNQPASHNINDTILTEADQCVKCGLCLPLCPTYQITQDEGDSPRGRISLAQGLASGQLAPNERLRFHIDRCLECRACEKVCPSKVQYGHIITATQQLLAQDITSPPPPLTRMGLKLLSRPRTLSALARLLRIYQVLGLYHIIKALKVSNLFGLSRLEQILPKLPKRRALKNNYPAQGEKLGQVSLFTGCITRLTDNETLFSAIKLITHCGYDVLIPDTQTCCGALHAHNQQPTQARLLAKQNIEAFDTTGLTAIITIASGCGAFLAEYDDHDATKDLSPLAAPVMDISQFLITQARLKQSTFEPLNETISLHTPCSLNNVMRQGQHPFDLLHLIPNLDVSPLKSPPSCCGGAGSYMLTQPEMSDSLCHDTLSSLKGSSTTQLATSNTGCAIHLTSGLDRNAWSNKIGVTHPINILARQLRPSGNK